MNTIKQEIKKLAEYQKYLKNQRKTVNLVGKREMPAWEAAYKVQSGKSTLTHLYAAYAILRGKEPFAPTRKELSQRLVDDLVDKYREKEVA